MAYRLLYETTAGGNADRVAELDTIAPQPVGLPNLLAKIAGGYVSEHWLTLAGADVSGVAKTVLEGISTSGLTPALAAELCASPVAGAVAPAPAPAKLPAQLAAAAASMERDIMGARQAAAGGVDQALAAVAGPPPAAAEAFEPASWRRDFAAVAERAEDDVLALVGSLDTAAAAEEFLAEAYSVGGDRVPIPGEADIAAALFALSGAAAVPATVSAGHATSRLLSAALFGTELLFAVVNAALRHVLGDDDAVDSAFAVAADATSSPDKDKDDPPTAAAFRGRVTRHLRHGHRLSAADERRLWALAATAVRRPVLVLPAAPKRDPTDAAPPHPAPAPTLYYPAACADATLAFTPPLVVSGAAAVLFPVAATPLALAPGVAVDVVPASHASAVPRTAEGAVLVRARPGDTTPVLAAMDGRVAPATVARLAAELQAAALAAASAAPSSPERQPWHLFRCAAPLRDGCAFRLSNALDQPCFTAPTGPEPVRAARSKTVERLLTSPGYGTDEFAAPYLMEGATMKHSSGLVVLSGDADGHCLLHAVSRTLVGKEYLWHALRDGLHGYGLRHKEDLRACFARSAALSVFADEEDDLLGKAIDQCRVDYDDPLGAGESEGRRLVGIASRRGLGTEHVFMLANMLRRPILLVDGPTAAPESFVVLPLLVAPAECASRSPLVIAWSSQEHGHYVPVVPRDDAPAVVAWPGIPQHGPDSATPGAPLLYAVPDDADPWAVLKAYVDIASTEDSGETPGAGASVLVAAGPGFDARSWCGHALAAFRSGHHGMSLWALHEEARRCALDPQEALRLVSLADIDDWAADAARRIAAGQCLSYCSHCTATIRYGAAYCPVCDRTVAKQIKFNPCLGRFEFGALTRLPFRSERSLKCCGMKHWFAHEAPATVGTTVWARPLASGFAPAVVTAVRADTLSGGKVYDVTFVETGAACHAVPEVDVANGYPVDRLARPQWYIFGATVSPVIAIDAAIELCSRPEDVAAAWTHIPARVDPGQMRKQIQELVTEELDAHRLQLMVQFKAPADSRRKSADPLGLDSVTDADAPLEPRHEDEEGRPVVWESQDPIERGWVEYDRAATGAIEAAFQAGRSTQTVTIPGYGKFTVSLVSLRQLNNIGGSRPVRRVRLPTLPPFSCAACTFENGAGRTTCEMCQTPSGQSGRRVVVRDEQSVAEERARVSLTDPRLAKGNHLYNSALGVASGIVVFPGAYGRFLSFYRSRTAERYCPLSATLDGTNPLYWEFLDKILGHYAADADAMPEFTAFVKARQWGPVPPLVLPRARVLSISVNADNVYDLREDGLLHAY